MRIGCLGLGNMGQPMAGKLLDGGHELWVCDVREEAVLPLLERQARKASSPKHWRITATQLSSRCPPSKSFEMRFQDPTACWLVKP